MSEKALQEPKAEEQLSLDDIREHYDHLAFFYQSLWGEHIHHGYWENAETPNSAQEKLVERLASLAGIKTGGRVLDVGCGLGGSALWLARNLNCSVLGLNLSPVQVAMATKKARDEGLDDRTEFRVLDAKHLGSLSESFDAVWVVECSEHLAYKERFISDCSRVLKRGGRLALCAWLRAETLPAHDGEQLVAEVCKAMLCPHLASMQDYLLWMRASGLNPLKAEDITLKVKETWVRAEEIVQRQEVKALIEAADDGTRRFVDAFTLMRRAFDGGAMAYGMFAAIKA
ncbi:MAG TPA: methyltransferase domain-containing protein [Pyrinomonadaceae bacterium]|nr:methyltransferase domain-containing protein [Pyrinomonadaceae bacterium]